MALDRQLIKQVRSLDEYDLRRLLILVRGILVQRGEEDVAAAGPSPRSAPGKVSYRLQTVSCGKPGCTRCPHGPYWYAFWREGGSVRSRYIGKHLPEDHQR